MAFETQTKDVSAEQNIVWDFPVGPDTAELDLSFRVDKGGPVDFVLMYRGEKFKHTLATGKMFNAGIYYRRDFEGLQLLGYPRKARATVTVFQTNTIRPSIVDKIGQLDGGPAT
jgi:hypothetical protein